MSTEDTITAFVEKMTAEGGTKVTAETSLLDSGIIDSTGILEVVSFIESEFGIRVQDEEIVPEHFESVQRIAAFVDTKRKG